MPGVRRLCLLGGLHRADAPPARRAGSAGAHRCLHAAGLVAADAAGVVGYQSTWPAQRVVGGAGRGAGVFPSVVAYLCYNRAIAELGAERASACLHLVPAFGALLSCLLLGETLHPWHVLGIAAVFAGLALGRSSR